jgi:GNAT superfamily N-acetyltransferase
MRIRPATAEDARAVPDIQVRGWQWAYRDLMPADYLDELSAEEGLPRWRTAIEESRDERRILVAEAEHAVVGFTALGPSRDDDAGSAAGEVYAIYVDPEHTRRGIGRALLGAAEAQLASLGHSTATLWVIEGNDRARRFYQAVGWRADDATKVDRRWGFELREVRHRVEL